MNNCDIIQDLLPMYIDDTLSSDSKSFVERHLAECEDCREALVFLKEEQHSLQKKDDYQLQIEDFRQQLRRQKKRRLLTAIAAFILAVTVITFFISSYLINQPDRGSLRRSSESR